LHDKELLMKNFFSHLNVDVKMVGYTKCPIDWCDIEYRPEYNKIYFIIDGEGWLKIGDREYYPQPGQLYFMPSGELQSYSSISPNTFLKYWCHFTARINNIDIFNMLNIPDFLNVTDKRELNNLFQRLLYYYGKGTPYSILKTRGIMLELLAWLFEQVNIRDINLQSYSFANDLLKVLKYIEDNLSKDITIEQLSNIIHFHPNYFIRFFRDHMGCSPIQYINRMRLEKAKNLLKATNLSIKEITDLTGFNDASYFSKKFKKDIGLSPLEYRNT
jgi:AraC family transcriptional regulator of arabinose operon